jgi:hypothetical protein
MDKPSTMGDTQFELEEADYHNVRRQEVRPATASTHDKQATAV